MDPIISSPGTQPTPPPAPAAKPNLASPQQAAAAAVTADALTADILRRHEAGEKITPREGGILGVYRKRLKSALGLGATQPASQNPFAPAPVPVRVGTVAPVETSGRGLAPVELDSGFARRTAVSLLNRLGALQTSWVTRRCRAAQISGDDLARITRAADFANDDKQLIGDIAPDICAELGVDPRKSPLIVAGAVLGAHALSLLQAVSEIKALEESRTNAAADKKLAEQVEIERIARARENPTS